MYRIANFPESGYQIKPDSINYPIVNYPIVGY